MTSAVKNIVHDDGSPLDVDNVIDVAVSYYINFGSLFDISIPGCSTTVKLGGQIYHKYDDFPYNGRYIYKDDESKNFLFYNESMHSMDAWIVAPNFNSTTQPVMISSSCPQQGGIFVDTTSDSFPNIVDWRQCSSMCYDSRTCNYWQYYDNNYCILIKDFKFIESATPDFFIGSKDCPGDMKVSQSVYGQCPENIPSKSMWKMGGDKFFTKNYLLEPFDPTVIILTGGYYGMHCFTHLHIYFNHHIYFVHTV